MSQNIVVASILETSSKSHTLRCQKCNYLNEDDAKFCIICGNALYLYTKKARIDTALNDEEEKSILESWDQITSGKKKEYDNVDEYIDSLDK